MMKKRLFGFVLACAMLLSFVPAASSLSTDYTAVLEADAGTQNNVRYTNNFGGSDTLRIRANDYFSAYFRFNVSAVQGYVSSAVLKLTPSRVDSTDVKLKVAVAETSQWVEGDLKGTAVDEEDPEQADFLRVQNRPAFDAQAYVAEGSPVQVNESISFTIPIDVIEAARSHSDEAERNKITLVVFVDGASDQNSAPNTYVYTKENTKSASYAPTLVVTGDEEMSDDIVVSMDETRLSLPNLTSVTKDIALPSTGYSGETQISWQAEGDGLRVEDGCAVVTRPASDQPNAQATLIATISKGDSSAQKRFDVTVLSLLYPQENTMVQDGSSAQYNFGARQTVSVRTEENNNLYQLAFFKFDLSYLDKDIDSAKLRLTLANTNNSFDPSDLRLAYSPIDGWLGGTVDTAEPTEAGGIIWRDKPFFERSSSLTPVCLSGGQTAGDVYEFDVTALAEQEYLRDGALTLALYSESPDKTRYDFYSSRAESGRPELVIEKTQESVYITNNGKKITDGYEGGELRVSAQLNENERLFVAQYKEGAMLMVSAANGAADWQTAQMTLNEIKDTSIKLIRMERDSLKPTAAAVSLSPTEGFVVEKRYPGFAPKAATFSFDDGVIEDVQLISIFDRYGIKGTFNLNSNNHTGDSKKEERDEDWVRETYEGHEVASHVKNHPDCTKITDDEFITLVQEGKAELSEIVGYEVGGMAWPLDDPRNKDPENDHSKLLDYVESAESGIEYARPSSPMRRNFELPEDYYYWQPSIKFPDLDVYGPAFMEMPDDGQMRLLYVWGHAYEFPQMNNWYLMEDFGKLVENRPDEVYLATNVDVVRYLKAMDQLVITDGSVTNGSDRALYVRINGVNRLLEPGQTVEK